MKPQYLLLSLALFGIGARATGSLDINDYDNLVTSITQDVLGGLDKTQSALSSFFPSTAGLSSSLSSWGDQLSTLYNTFEAQYCTEASFDYGVKKPATFVGPSFSLTFDTGSCVFNSTLFWETGKKVLECVEPSIIFVKDPAVFKSKRKTPVTFTSKTCNISKTFGEEWNSTLYVFDGSKNQVSVGDLTAKITAEVQNALTSLTDSVTSLPSTLSNLVDSIPDTIDEYKQEGADLLAGLHGGAPKAPVSGARTGPKSPAAKSPAAKSPAAKAYAYAA